MSAAPINHWSVGALGVVTICTYGSWYYAFGVLLDPIRLDTGWRESTLAASFSAGTMLIGLLSIAGGRLLDRFGHALVLALAGTCGATSMLAASYATQMWVFFVGSALTLASLGSLGFYHITMTAAVRTNPTNPTRAIAVLTIWGALASAIYLPATNYLLDWFGWRQAVRVLAAIVFVVCWAAIRVVPKVPAVAQEDRAPLREILAGAVGLPQRRLFTAAVAFGGIAMATMLVYQVPAMTAAGLSAGAAASMAGLRGFSQLGGRVPLTPLVTWLGVDRALVVAFSAITLGGVLLAFSGNIAIATAFALVAGFGIGAFSPLQGMKSEELFDRDNLGATMGFFGMVLVLAGSIGPVLAGFLSERTGDRRWAAVIVIVAGSLAALCILALTRITARDHAVPTMSADTT